MGVHPSKLKLFETFHALDESLLLRIGLPSLVLQSTEGLGQGRSGRPVRKRPAVARTAAARISSRAQPGQWDMPMMLEQLAADGHDHRSQLGWGATLKSHWEPDDRSTVSSRSPMPIRVIKTPWKPCAAAL
jgi:hypothetical protein